MRKVLLSSVVLIISVGGAFGETVEGYISDAHCGAKHDSVSEANSKCVAGCIKHSDPVLVKEGKVLQFDADSKEKAKAFAGEKVKIDGDVSGDVIKITAISKGA